MWWNIDPSVVEHSAKHGGTQSHLGPTVGKRTTESCPNRHSIVRVSVVLHWNKTPAVTTACILIPLRLWRAGIITNDNHLPQCLTILDIRYTRWPGHRSSGQVPDTANTLPNNLRATRDSLSGIHRQGWVFYTHFKPREETTAVPVFVMLMAMIVSLTCYSSYAT